MYKLYKDFFYPNYKYIIFIIMLIFLFIIFFSFSLKIIDFVIFKFYNLFV
ncbi:hypothetical protein [Candidatus Nardonella dryophthoridicola]|nr:hypothetical protein [Candidatus Nardonella dryophthoridicola]